MKPCPVCREQIQDVAVKCRYCGEIFDKALKRKQRSRRGVPWYKKILFGLGWWVLIYLGISFLLGAIVGGIAGSRDPDNAQEAAARAGEEFGKRWSAPLLIIPAILAFAGAGFGILPGTRPEDRR